MTLRFGVDAEAQLGEWWHETYLPSFHQEYDQRHQPAEIAVLICGPKGNEYSEPVVLSTTVGGRQRLVELLLNIQHELNFYRRTGLNSSEAAARADLLEPGDFPYPGAGEYKDYIGGACGLAQYQDRKVFTEVVERLIVLRREAAVPAIAASKADVSGWKYLESEDIPPILEA